MKKKYLAWVGSSRTTYGKPHKKTGRYDLHGRLYIFDNKKERDVFCYEYDNHWHTYPVATTKKEAKARYFAGHTQQQFEEHLNWVEYHGNYNGDRSWITY